MLPPESGWPVLDSSLSFTRAQFDSFLSVAVPGGILLGGLGLLAAVATALWRAPSRSRWVVTKVVPCMLCYGVVVTTRNVNEAICYLSADIKLPPTLAGSSGRASLAAGAGEAACTLCKIFCPSCFCTISHQNNNSQVDNIEADIMLLAGDR